MAPFPSPTSNWHTQTYHSISPTRPELSAKGKTIVITGGTGIGAETARHFAEAGASRIVLLGRREQPLLDTKASIDSKCSGVEVLVASADVTKKTEVDEVFTRFVGGGNVHVLVSNAAVIGPQDAVGDVDGDKFLDAIHQNLKGSLNIAQAFLRYASKDAVAIETSSSAAHLNFAPGFASYSIAKLAVFRLWDSLAFANPELSIFHIQPGVVDTAMNREAGGVAAMGFADDVSLPASFNVWLASGEARFLRGKYLWANWDVDELKAQEEEIAASPRLSIGLVGWPFDSAGWKSNWKTETDGSV
ncbi:putative oxidoreductase [Aspergillus bombycis]|uniref:Putative oxidoreductase n=1 Tax=Aspergillus bombycis TaxID=109264 RepID=A0A1F8AA62_9EURO|nr:putative oxidoreductase [Aspergillus bombycis]OGM48255.1 putative oxidoreductase [Aspergillus bombycis]